MTEWVGVLVVLVLVVSNLEFLIHQLDKGIPFFCGSIVFMSICVRVHAWKKVQQQKRSDQYGEKADDRQLSEKDRDVIGDYGAVVLFSVYIWDQVVGVDRPTGHHGEDKGTEPTACHDNPTDHAFLLREVLVAVSYRDHIEEPYEDSSQNAKEQGEGVEGVGVRRQVEGDADACRHDYTYGLGLDLLHEFDPERHGCSLSEDHKGEDHGSYFCGEVLAVHDSVVTGDVDADDSPKVCSADNQRNQEPSKD